MDDRAGHSFPDLDPPASTTKTAGPRRSIEGAWRRWSTPIAFAITTLALGLFAWFVWLYATDPRLAAIRGVDRATYQAAGLRVLAGGSWFYPDQVAGQPYEVLVGHVMYPPVAMLWLVPAALVPDAIWWGLPLVILAAVCAYHRPAPWGWVAMALCLAFPSTSQLIVAGNPGLWIAGAVAIGTLWPPAYAMVFLKPSLFPFALLGARNRGWWLLFVAGVLLSAVMLPLTLQWIGVIANARGNYSGLLYSATAVALLLVPVIAWRTGSRRRRSAA